MNTNPYVKTTWYDEIADPVTGEVIEEGTRFTASRANKIEDGIYNAYEWLIEQQNEIRRLQVQLEIEGRAPGNSGSFFDTLNGTTNRLTKQTASADITQAVSAGATVLNVDDATGFVAFTEVTVYDGTNSEDTLVTKVDTVNQTITVQALTNAYVKGAKIARSNAKNDTTEKTLTFGEWSTYSVSVEEVI